MGELVLVYHAFDGEKCLKHDLQAIPYFGQMNRMALFEATALFGDCGSRRQT